MGGRARRIAVCRVAVLVAWPLAGRGSLRPTGSLARRAGLLRLDSAAAGDGDARFTVYFMLIVSCAPGHSLSSMIALLLSVGLDEHWWLAYMMVLCKSCIFEV